MSTAALLRAPAVRPNQPLAMQIGFDADISHCGAYRWSLRRWFSQGGRGYRLFPFSPTQMELPYER